MSQQAIKVVAICRHKGSCSQSSKSAKSISAKEVDKKPAVKITKIISIMMAQFAAYVFSINILIFISVDIIYIQQAVHSVKEKEENKKKKKNNAFLISTILWFHRKKAENKWDIKWLACMSDWQAK